MPFTCGECLLMVDAVMLKAVEHQPVVRAKAIGVDNALGYDFSSDDLAQSLSGNVFDNARVNAAIAPKQAENGDFTSSTTSATAFATTAEVRLVTFNLAAERTLAFALFGEAAADHLVDTLCCVTIDVYCSDRTARRHF